MSIAQIDVQMDELAISQDSPLAGKTVSEMEVRGKGAFLIVALRKTDGTTIVHPQHEILLDSWRYGDRNGTSR